MDNIFSKQELEEMEKLHSIYGMISNSLIGEGVGEYIKEEILKYASIKGHDEYTRATGIKNK
ncbi:hypothetical protein ACI3ER_11305 [Bacillus sp. Wb]